MNIPVSDSLPPYTQLMLASGRKKVNKLLLENFPRKTLLRTEPLQSLLQCIRQSRWAWHIRLDRRQRGHADLDFLLDSPPSSCQDCAEGVMGMQVCTGDTHLEASAGWLAHRRGYDPDRSRSVLQSPTDIDRGPVVLDKAFVGVDCRGEQRHEIWQCLQETSKEMSAQV